MIVGVVWLLTVSPAAAIVLVGAILLVAAFGILQKRLPIKLPHIDIITEEEARRRKRVRALIRNLIEQTEDFIKKAHALRDEAINQNDSDWLYALDKLDDEEYGFPGFRRKFNAGELALSDAQRQIEELKTTAENLSRGLFVHPPPREEPAKERKLNYYEVLGAPQDATLSQLKRMYDALAMMYHPDVAKNEKERKEHEEKMKKINEAFATLKDEQKRKKYDEEIGRVG
jgi:hypothetical protein